MKKIFVTRKIPERGITMLKEKGFEVSISPDDRGLSKNELIGLAQGSDGLLCLLTDKIDG